MRQPDSGVAFREMGPADIDAGLRLCRASRWNQVRRDWEAFLTLSPYGCRVAVQDGRVVGTVTTVSYGAFAWVGMVLVDPAARGQGIGTRLMQEALGIMTEVPRVRLDATPAGRELYLRLGFADEYGLRRMARPAATDRGTTSDHTARPMTRDDLEEVATFDHEVFGADRRAVIEWALEGAPEYAWVHEARSRLTGYVLGRHGFDAEHLGPVIATDQQVAGDLVAACLDQESRRPFFLDASGHDEQWLRWLESRGFREQRPFMRMSRGDVSHDGPPREQYAILGPEFG